MSNKDSKRCKVGELRPSQALTTFGIGSIIDLPNLSVMVMGLDDCPWRAFVHRDEKTTCKGGLKLIETSATGEAASIFVQCEGENCKAIRPMSDAFKMDVMALPVCKARRPHLRDHDDAGCKAPN